MISDHTATHLLADVAHFFWMKTSMRIEKVGEGPEFHAYGNQGESFLFWVTPNNEIPALHVLYQNSNKEQSNLVSPFVNLGAPFALDTFLSKVLGLCQSDNKPFKPAREDIQRLSIVQLDRPGWYTEPEFMAWLNNPNNCTMTFHMRGEDPNEWSDALVWVDPSLNGEGDSSEMPEKYWREILHCAAAAVNGIASTGHHIGVKIRNM
jgi:hypothetical protein